MEANFAEINLFDDQQEPFEKAVDILMKNMFYIDGSATGAGKTIVALAVAKHFNLTVVVVCPKTAVNGWLGYLGKYGIMTHRFANGDWAVASYGIYKGASTYQPKSGLLTRQEAVDKNGRTVFTRTPSLENLLTMKDTLFIFDEAQALKNKSDAHYMFKDLFNAVVEYIQLNPTRPDGTPITARFAILSGSLFDDPTGAQAIGFLQAVRYITDRELYRVDKNGEMELKGIQQLMQRASSLNNDKYLNFATQNPLPAKFNPGTARQYAYDLFKTVIRDELLVISTYEKYEDVKYSYYGMLPSELEGYEYSIRRLAQAIGYSFDRQAIVNPESGNFGAITPALVAVQNSKLKFIERITNYLLTTSFSNENGEQVYPKVIIFSNYNESVLDVLMNSLQQYNPLIINGKITTKKRTENQNLFQEHSTRNRLLLANIVTGGKAIDLHDTNGKYPRYSLILPDFRINDMFQAVGRTSRRGSKSMSTVRILFGRSALLEHSVLRSLIKGGIGLEEIVGKQAESGVKFPHEYGSYIEDDGDDVTKQKYPPEVTERPIRDDNAIQIIKAYESAREKGELKR